MPLAAGVFDRVEPFDISDPDSEVERGYAAYEAAQGVKANSDVVLLVEPAEPGPAGAAGTALVAETEAKLGDVAGIASVNGPEDDPALISRDRGAALVLGRAEAGSNRVDLGAAVAEAFAGVDGVTAGGDAIVAYEIGEQTEHDTRRIELFAAPLLLLLLLFVFRAPLAAALPLILSGCSIVITLALLALLAGVVDIDLFSLQVVTGLGVGLAIDYSLFMLARYRIELRRGDGYETAQRRTVATAGRTVVFGALTVAAALAALIVFPQQFLASTGIAGCLVALLSGLSALIVLPAALALLGPRVDPGWAAAADRGAPPRDPLSGGSGFWTRVSGRVLRAPWPVATLALVLMLAIASPALGGSLTSPDASALPEGSGARIVAETAASAFEAGNPTDLGVLIPPQQPDADAVSASTQLATIDGVRVGNEFELEDGSTYAHITAPVEPFSAAGQDLVAELRALPWPAGSLVSGRAAELTDQRQSIAAQAPLVIMIVVVTNLLLVAAMTRSLILPLVSIALNGLTVLAAYGLMVTAFETEAIANLLGATVQDGIDVSVPVLAFAVVFGLSTDYGIFLFSRIAEARRDGLSDQAAITAGLSRTGRLITSAAVIFAVAVGANVFSDLVIVKEFAVAVAVAVILDATIVRGLLVPAILKLLGAAAWWPGRARDRASFREA